MSTGRRCALLPSMGRGNGEEQSRWRTAPITVASEQHWSMGQTALPWSESHAYCSDHQSAPVGLDGGATPRALQPTGVGGGKATVVGGRSRSGEAMAATWCATPREPHALAGRTAHMQSLELHGRVIHVLHCTKLQHEHHRTAERYSELHVNRMAQVHRVEGARDESGRGEQQEVEGRAREEEGGARTICRRGEVAGAAAGRRGKQQRGRPWRPRTAG